jgi:hypothetical protein
VLQLLQPMMPMNTFLFASFSSSNCLDTVPIRTDKKRKKTIMNHVTVPFRGTLTIVFGPLFYPSGPTFPMVIGHMAFFSGLRRRGAQADCCAGAVLKFTLAASTYTAPTITLNLVSCVFTTPHHQGKPGEARAHPKNRLVPLKPSATISKPRQLGVPLDLYTSPACDTTPNAPHRQIHTFCTFALAPHAFPYFARWTICLRSYPSPPVHPCHPQARPVYSVKEVVACASPTCRLPF